MEIADLFDVNKADRPGADRLAREVDMMLHLRLGSTLKHIPAHHGVIKKKSAPTPLRPSEPSQDWVIPVLQTVAETGKGVEELAAAMDKHRSWLRDSGELAKRRQKRLRERVRDAVERRLQDIAWRDRGGEGILESALAELESGKVSPYAVAERIVVAVTG
jgi:LAO/AO transport system kinase